MILRILQGFISCYADLASPMTDLFINTKPWVWVPAEAKSFSELQAALVNLAELAFPDFARTFTVHLELSATAIGATSSQENDSEQLRLITCTSTKLTLLSVITRPTTQRQMLLIVCLYLLVKRIRGDSSTKWIRGYGTGITLAVSCGTSVLAPRSNLGRRPNCPS